jgi:parallel beta-helix repeat protein
MILKNKQKTFISTIILLGNLLLSSCKKDLPQVTASPDSIFTDSKNLSNSTIGVPSGTILREEWDGTSGSNLANIPVQNPVSSSEQISSMTWPLNYGQNYSDRLRGYIYPPITGNYIFWISADDVSALYLSTNNNPSNKIKIADNSSWTHAGVFNQFASQKSVPIMLQANKKYYIETLRIQNKGGSSLSVQWQLPNKIIESPIPGSRLSPFGTAASKYTPSHVVYLNGAHDLTISGLSIVGGTANPVLLTNCHNIHITQNKFYNSTKEGIYLSKCYNITIDYNYFTEVSTGVEAINCNTGGIKVNNNQFLNMLGPMPRGQFVQFDQVGGAGNSISYNKCVNILGQSNPEDAINIFESYGTPSSPINIVGNWIRGGGPSATGGGIMLGDYGGSYQYAADNVLVNPGAYGMAITAGDHNSIVNNYIFASAQSFTNVGIDQWAWAGLPITNSTITGNYVNFTNSANKPNNSWLGSGTPKGWANNTWGAKIGSNILPPVLITAD